MDLQSILGYSKGSPFANNPYLDINTPDGLIDMSNTDIDLWGIDNKGNKKKMKAGRKKPYQFPGDQVREIPMQKGGPTREDIYKFLFDDDEESPAPATVPDKNEITTEKKTQVKKEDQSYNLAMMIASQDRYRPNPYKNPRTDRFSGEVINDKGQFAYEYLQQKGIAPHVAAGMVGNFVQESGNFRDDVISGDIKGDNGLATGIAQWHPDRWKAAEKWASSQGINIRTLKGQLDWAVHEASQRGDLQKVSKAKNTEEAAYLFAKHYERPKIIDNNRARFAKKYNPYKQGGIYQEIFKTNE